MQMSNHMTIFSHILCCCSVAVAQPRPSSLSLATVERLTAPQFTRVFSVHERDDGAILVSDLGDQLLYVVRNKRSSVVGRVGPGPGEYKGPLFLFPMSADTVLAADASDRRWHLLVGTKLLTPSESRRQMATTLGAAIEGISATGSILSVMGHGKQRPGEQYLYMGSPTNADTVVAVLSTTRALQDTVAWLKGQYFGRKNAMKAIDGVRMEQRGIRNPYETNDQAVMYSDGFVAVAHFDPYSVDWRDPNGRWTRGAAINDRMATMTSAMKEEVAADRQRDSDGRPVFALSDFPPFPERVPPFVPYSLIAMKDGRLAVLRARLSRSKTQQVDVFDRRGVRVLSFLVPAGIRPIATGATGLIGIGRNEDDLEYLVRIILPKV